MNLEAIQCDIWYHTTTVTYKSGNFREIARLHQLAVRYTFEEPGVVQLVLIKNRYAPFKQSQLWYALKAEYPSAETDQSENYPVITITDPFDCIKFKFRFSA